MGAFHRSSGDLIADRRYRYGTELACNGDFSAAADLFKQALERAPGWPAAWFALGRALTALFDLTASAAAFRECLKLDPADTLGASLELARIDAAVTIDAAPTAYVAALFDAYAPDFDNALVERLHYSTPQKLAALIRETRTDAGKFPRTLDLGCGTGLLGEALAAEIIWLEGVDISAGMINQAGEKGVYNALHQSDILTFLLEAGDCYDAIFAADVFTYFGDLSRVMRQAAHRLRPGGIIAFSVERTETPAWIIGDSLRFAHGVDYVVEVIKTSGMNLVRLEAAVLRKDRGADVDGLLVIARTPYHHAAEQGLAVKSGRSEHDEALLC